MQVGQGRFPDPPGLRVATNYVVISCWATRSLLAIVIAVLVTVLVLVILFRARVEQVAEQVIVIVVVVIVKVVVVIQLRFHRADGDFAVIRLGLKRVRLAFKHLDPLEHRGEINRRVQDASAALVEIERRYAADALAIDHTDGVGIEFADWRFNLRKSNTEPLIRLNVETRGDRDLLSRRTDELLALLT